MTSVTTSPAHISSSPIVVTSNATTNIQEDLASNSYFKPIIVSSHTSNPPNDLVVKTVTEKEARILDTSSNPGLHILSLYVISQQRK